jgi:Ca2+/H+ antiporter
LPYDRGVVRRLLNLLLAALPIAVASRLLHWPEWATFAAAAVSLLPLAGWIGRATEHAAG